LTSDARRRGSRNTVRTLPPCATPPRSLIVWYLMVLPPRYESSSLCTTALFLSSARLAELAGCFTVEMVAPDESARLLKWHDKQSFEKLSDCTDMVSGMRQVYSSEEAKIARLARQTISGALLFVCSPTSSKSFATDRSFVRMLCWSTPQLPVLRKDEIHVVSDAIPNFFANSTYSIQPGDQGVPVVGGNAFAT